MLALLKNHPFAVEAFFEYSIVLTFAFSKAELEKLIPECLALDTLNDQWAFVAVAVVKTKNLRPKGFPQFTGNDFILIGYRIFVKYTNNAGKQLRGLYILKSETDKRLMEVLGNVFTRYSYTTTDIQVEQRQGNFAISANQSDFSVSLETGQEQIPLPNGSPFTDWKQARKFAGPLPFTFSYRPKNKEVLIIEGVRENWIPEPIKVISHHIPFINTIGRGNGVLANAFIINNIPYYWKKGHVELWNR